MPATQLAKILTNPAVDRRIGIIMGLIWAGLAVFRYSQHPFFPELFGYVCASLVTTFTLFSRRSPSRVSERLSVWMFVSAVNFLGLFAATLSPPGERVVPREFTLPLGVLLALLTIFIRLNLGRNIGLVPARRQLVTSGAYRWVRHPLYGTNILSFTVLLLSRFSIVLAAFFVLLVGGYVAKAWLEENLLSEEEDYRAYQKAVRWKFIPFLY